MTLRAKAMHVLTSPFWTHHKLGLIDNSWYQAALFVVLAQLKSPGGQQAWKDLQKAYREEFVAMIEGSMREFSQVPPLAKSWTGYKWSQILAPLHSAQISSVSLTNRLSSLGGPLLAKNMAVRVLDPEKNMAVRVLFPAGTGMLPETRAPPAAGLFV